MIGIIIGLVFWPPSVLLLSKAFGIWQALSSARDIAATVFILPVALFALGGGVCLLLAVLLTVRGLMLLADFKKHGAISMDHQAIMFGSRKIRFDQVTDISVSRAKVVIRTLDGRFYKIGELTKEPEAVVWILKYRLEKYRQVHCCAA